MGGMLVRQEPASISAVRRELCLDLDLHSLDRETIEDAELVLSEILGNAVRHCPTGREELDVTWHIADQAVTVSVEDPCGEVLPVRRSAAPDAASGRGLAIVEALTSDWGVDRTSRGKRVWGTIARKSA